MVLKVHYDFMIRYLHNRFVTTVWGTLIGVEVECPDGVLMYL